MQKDPLVALLVGALCVCAVFTFAVTVGYDWHLHQLKHLQPQLVNIQNSQNMANALLNDTVAYSKQHPAISPIIQAALNSAPQATP